MTELLMIRKERKINFPGEVLVKEGDRVQAETVIVRGVYNPRRLFFVEIADSLRVTPPEIPRYVLKQQGARVRIGDVLAERRVTLTETARRKSPVDGTITRISAESGHIIVEENEMDLEPKTVNVAEELGVQPGELPRYMKKRVGEMVQKGGAVAELPLLAGFRLVRCASPIYARIESVDTETGEVVLQRPHEEVELRSGLPGEVETVIPERGAVIRTRGYRVQGVMGFGREAYGKLECIEEVGGHVKGKIVASKRRLSADEICALRERGTAGIVLSELCVEDVEGLFGAEVYSGVTGKADEGIVLVLFQGFGTEPMTEKDWEFFRSLEGSSAYLNGITQIRAGVIRPELIVLPRM